MDYFQKKDDLGDSIMTAIVWAADEESRFVLLQEKAFYFTHLGRLRVQECERVFSLKTELTKCGAKVVEEGDTLTVYPVTVARRGDRNLQRSSDGDVFFAILGLKVPGIRI